MYLLYVSTLRGMFASLAIDSEVLVTSTTKYYDSLYINDIMRSRLTFNSGRESRWFSSVGKVLFFEYFLVFTTLSFSKSFLSSINCDVIRVPRIRGIHMYILGLVTSYYLLQYR